MAKINANVVSSSVVTARWDDRRAKVEMAKMRAFIIVTSLETHQLTFPSNKDRSHWRASVLDSIFLTLQDRRTCSYRQRQRHQSQETVNGLSG